MAFQTFTPLQYLKIDIASSFGLDKESWVDRIAWFDMHYNDLEDKVREAEEPALYWAGVQAYRAVMRGEPIGHMISLDATSSGLQILAALSGDTKAASLCNVIPRMKDGVEQRADAYTIIYEMMLAKIGEAAKIQRKDTKNAIMTALYSSTAVPKAVFGEGILLDIFYETLNEEAPGAWELNEGFLAMWDKTALSHDWILPDNFHVKVKVIDRSSEKFHIFNQPFEVFTKINAPMDSGRSLGANSIHSIDGMIVREMSRRCDYNPEHIKWLHEHVRNVIQYTSSSNHQSYSFVGNQELANRLFELAEQSGFLSARVLEAIGTGTILSKKQWQEVQELLKTLPEKPFKVVSVHDCFRCLPTYGNDLRWQYTNLLHLIAKSEMLSFHVSQLMGQHVSIRKLNPKLHEQVMDANYALS